MVKSKSKAPGGTAHQMGGEGKREKKKTEKLHPNMKEGPQWF
jgi:hypothetical protein